MAREDKITLIIQELVRRSNEESRRLRSIEQRLLALESRTQALEGSGSLRTKRITDKIMEFEAAIKSQDEIVMKLKNSFDKLAKQSDKYARKSDVKEVEKMFDLLNPLAQQYATKKDLEELKKRIE